MDLATIGFRADTSGLVRARGDLDKLAVQGERTEGRVSSAMGAIGKAFAVVASAAGVGTLASKLIETERSTGILTASLKVATGSAQNASEAFGAIQRLATQLPESVDSVSNAFIKLTNMGLDPSEAAIKSYSNTAAAMGKDLNQMIEAVADAATGEFERLKEFGIKAKQQGDQVSFTFRGVTTTVKKEADAISGYLRDIGDVTFAGAAEERMKTLDGAISNLGDTWDGLFRTINSAGVGEFIADAVRMASSALQGLNDFIASGQLGGYIDALGIKFGGVADAATMAFEQVVVSYEWLNGMLAPSSGGVVDFIIDAFKNLPENIKAFIQIAVVEIAAFVDKAAAYGTQLARNLNPVTAIKDAIGGYDELNQKLDVINSARQDSIIAIMDERQAAIDSFDAQVEKVGEMTVATESAGEVLGKYGVKAQEAATATAAIPKELQSMKDIVDEMEFDELFQGMEGYDFTENIEAIDSQREGLDALIESVDNFGGAWTSTGNTVADALGSIVDQMDSYQDRVISLGKLEQDYAVQKAKITDKESADYKSLMSTRRKLDAEQLRAQVSGYKTAANVFVSMTKEGTKERKAAHSVSMAISAIEMAMSLKETAVSLAAGASKFFAQSGWGGFAGVAAMAAVMGGLGYSMSGGGGGGASPEDIQAGQGTGTVLGSGGKSASAGNAMDLFSDIALDQLAELRGIRDAMTGLSKGFELLARDFVAGGSFKGAGVSGMGTTNAGGGVRNVFGDIEKSLFGGDSVTKKLFGTVKKEVKDSGLQFQDQELGEILAGNLEVYFYDTIETTKKKLFGLSKKKSTSVQLSDVDAAFENQIQDIFGFIGSAVSGSLDSLGLESTNALENFKVNLGKVSFKDLTGEEIQAELEAIFSQQADLITGFVAPTMAEYQKMGEGLFETLTRVAKEQAVFSDAIENIGLDLSGLSAIMRIDVAQSIIELMGGLEEFSDKTSEYFDAFFSESEKFDMLTGGLNEAFGSLNLSLPQSRDEFRALVEGLDLTTESGQKLFAGLMELVPSLDSYITGVEKSAEAQANAAQKLKEAEESANKAAAAAQARIDSQRNSLEIQLLQAQGKIEEATARRRELELAGLDESLRAIQEQIFAQQDANAAMEQAKKLAEEQARAAEDAARAQAEAAEDALRAAERLAREQAQTAEDAARAQIEAAEDAAREQREAAEDAARAQIQAQQEATRAAEQAAEEQRRLIEGTQDAITAAIRALRGESEDLNDIDRQRAKNTLNAALAAAQAGKSVIGFAGLEDALTAVQKIDKSQFASAEAYQREVGQTLSILDRLGGYAGLAPKTPMPTTSPVIPMGTVTQAQTTQQLAVNVQNMEAQMIDLTKRIEKNTKTNADLMQRWEAIGMPATRA